MRPSKKEKDNTKLNNRQEWKLTNELCKNNRKLKRKDFKRSTEEKRKRDNEELMKLHKKLQDSKL